MTLDQEVLQTQLLQWLETQIQSPHNLLEKTLQLLRKKAPSQPQKDAQQLAGRVQRLRHMREKQLHMFEMDVITAQELQQRVAHIDAQLQQCSAQHGQADKHSGEGQTDHSGASSAPVQIVPKLDTRLE